MAPADPELRDLVKEMNRSVLAGRFQREENKTLDVTGEICPSAVMPVIAVNRSGLERVFPMKWGFSQRGKLIINARVETAAEKITFREAWQSHRCVIPASWYFEWEHDQKKRSGRKYALRPVSSGIIRLAGLYRMEDGLPVFVILTRPATEGLAWMHDRMPVMLPEKAAKQWIHPENDPAIVVKQCNTDISWRYAG